MRAIAGLAFTLISTLAWNAHASQSAPPAAPREPYTAAHPPDQSHAGSKVSIAWLSDVEGEVQLASAAGKEFQRALSHTSVLEGNIIRTGMGRAEVELQDLSTIRLGPYSVIAFPQLELLPSGIKASSVRAFQGTIYISLMPRYIVDSKGNELQLTFGQQQLQLQNSGHVRLEMDATEARLALLDGKGQVSGPFGSMELARKKTFTFDLTGQSQPAVSKKVVSNPMDKWDMTAVFYERHGSLSSSRGLFRGP
ncbi:hypothetical protein H7849_12020 [Alloacidobacterium dinghuense]|uniref:FecR protein domain-containing protein n=1 Tax=Alloacidobacterium dinghuense TaxID=2763107 RepID=A0A7G8BPT1_9BACT|nr:hypothetical protein [Alloacidobacterium dinghuense]QNI34551.1 hypothetical protein H7849_12020 [Alloacidobacterium dinghuense]